MEIAHDFEARQFHEAVCILGAKIDGIQKEIDPLSKRVSKLVHERCLRHDTSTTSLPEYDEKREIFTAQMDNSSDDDDIADLQADHYPGPTPLFGLRPKKSVQVHSADTDLVVWHKNATLAIKQTTSAVVSQIGLVMWLQEEESYLEEINKDTSSSLSTNSSSSSSDTNTTNTTNEIMSKLNLRIQRGFSLDSLDSYGDQDPSTIDYQSYSQKLLQKREQLKQNALSVLDEIANAIDEEPSHTTEHINQTTQHFEHAHQQQQQHSANDQDNSFFDDFEQNFHASTSSTTAATTITATSSEQQFSTKDKQQQRTIESLSSKSFFQATPQVLFEKAEKVKGFRKGAVVFKATLSQIEKHIQK